MRLNNIDLLKGILLLLVITGHILQGAVTENLARYIIYSFHMPMFIGISGYLFNTAKVSSFSFKELFNKYFFRVIVPWVIAVIVYTIAEHYGKHPVRGWLILLAKDFVYPFYHLWFIPAFLSWVFLTWIAKKLNVSNNILLALSALISLTAFILYTFPGVHPRTHLLDKAIKMVLFTFRPYFYVFFVFGSYLRTRELPVKLNFMGIVSAVSFTGIILLFFFPNKIAGIILFFVFNMSFLTVLVRGAQKELLPRSNVIEWIGINSLGIYLWHVLPLLFLEKWPGTANLPLFYSLCFAGEVLFIFIMMQVAKIKPVNKYVLGMG